MSLLEKLSKKDQIAEGALLPFYFLSGMKT